MAETDRHRKLMLGLLHALTERFRNKPRVYVTGDIFVYYRDENGELQPVSPDIFVVRGVANHERRVYKIEDEGKAPEVVIELISRATAVEDYVTKRHIYALLGVKEYFIFDPYREAQPSALAGFRLERGKYVPMTVARHNGSLHLRSKILGLELRVEKGLLRLYDPKTGERLRTPEEAEAMARQESKRRQEAEAKAAAADARAAAAEAEAARLRKQLAKLQRRKP
ncbi:MAG: Uma2 family endonuclease [candidate division KSB1 bacterium]|nr:Uma2 family endonuclease [candidate division KSB1 bacterium]MDZ7368769.1 Uma2 family endonuclease [candidate division KSB1 bacterium]MDZ7406579.1 Uma2 family endonuclease [candidate division KSB1 bacterium]